MRLIGHVWIVVVLLAASCNVAAPIPSPTGSAAQTPFVTPGATDIPVPPVATSSPLVPASELPPTASEPAPTPTTVRTSGPTEAPSSDVWRRVTEWPSAPAHVSAVVAGGPGFVAVGYESKGAYLCERPSVDGIVWTSSNGENWIETRPEALAGLSLRRLVNAGGTIYAFGSVGHSDCVDEYVVAIARSLDGSSWDRLQPDLRDDFFFDAVGASEERLIVLTDDTTWTSADGTHWQRAGDLPFSYSWFEGIAAFGETAVAFEGLAETPISFSTDTGQSWRHADLAPLYNLVVNDAVAGDERIVAVGAACCALPNESAGVTMTSTDGEHWDKSGLMRDVPQSVAALPDGYLAVGRQTWISRDGLDWRVGPRISELDTTQEVTAVSTDSGVLVMNRTICCTFGAEFADAAWFASSGALALERWTETPPAAEMPEMGVRYPSAVFLHCGWPPIHFGLRAWLADPPFEDNISPPPGFGDEDRGWLTQLSDNELEYESRRGQKVILRPSAEPVALGPCA